MIFSFNLISSDLLPLEVGDHSAKRGIRWRTSHKGMSIKLRLTALPMVIPIRRPMRVGEPMISKRTGGPKKNSRQTNKLTPLTRAPRQPKAPCEMRRGSSHSKLAPTTPNARFNPATPATEKATTTRLYARVDRSACWSREVISRKVQHRNKVGR